MSMFKSLPTVLWMAGATLALGAMTPVIGQQVTDPPPAAAPAAESEPSAGGDGENGDGENGDGENGNGEDGAAPSDPTGDAGEPSGDAPSSGGTAEGEGEVLVQETTTGLGPTAVDAEGYTLYRSDLDGHNPSASVCVSEKCVTAWKPVYLPSGAVEPAAGSGIDAADLGSVQRPDGTWQATLGGWPLYLYDKDQVPGDVRGEGLKGTWHAIAPDGKKAVDAGRS